MTLQQHPIGLIGLGVMGRNLALNLADHGHTVAIWDRDPEAITRAVAAQPEGRLAGAATLADFVAALARPRQVLLMVNAGAPVDDVIARLQPLLEAGDVIIDGGNSLYTDTERRAAALAAVGLDFVGAGVSGGEEGARKGPAIMPGGPAAALARLQPLFASIAARVDGEPCVTPVGPGGSGHYVKMVHNGIEYGDMQLICEAYALLQAAGFDTDAMAAVFAGWNAGPLRSYLIEITAAILAQRDAETGTPVVDLILDKAGQKGTGQWTLVNAAQQAVVVSVMGAAVDARVLSSRKDARVAASARLQGPPPMLAVPPAERAAFVERLGQALYAAKIISYAQGFDLLRTTSEQRGWQLDLGAIARIWRGGCIIRAQFLSRITEACATVDGAAPVAHLLEAPYFAQALNTAQGAWRAVVAQAVMAGVPVPALSAALAYHDASRSARLPANLLQAQRDFFGAHTYERVDRPAGQAFHTLWPAVQG
jgi:6-phosphogluconate dehydrogenase